MFNERCEIHGSYSNVVGSFLIGKYGNTLASHGFNDTDSFSPILNNLFKIHSKETIHGTYGGSLTTPVDLGSKKTFLNLTDKSLRVTHEKELPSLYLPTEGELYNPFLGNILIVEVNTLVLPTVEAELYGVKNTYQEEIDKLSDNDDQTLLSFKQIDIYKEALSLLMDGSNLSKLENALCIKTVNVSLIPFEERCVYVSEYGLIIGDATTSLPGHDTNPGEVYGFSKPTEEEIKRKQECNKLIERLVRYRDGRLVHTLNSDPVSRTYNLVMHHDTMFDLLNPSVRGSASKGYISVEDFLENMIGSMYQVIQSMINKLLDRNASEFERNDIKSFLSFLSFYLGEEQDVDEE